MKPMPPLQISGVMQEVACCVSLRRLSNIPGYSMRPSCTSAQDLGARSIAAAHEMLANGTMFLETRTGAAQAEGNVHDMHSYDKVRW